MESKSAVAASPFDPFPKSFDALLVANGSPPTRKLLRALAGRASCVIALDGGLAALFRCGIVPDHVVGDFDSAPERPLRWAVKNGAQLHRRPSADKPDFAKGLDLCKKLKCRRVVALGIAGERLDHVLSALHFSLSARGLDVTLATKEIVLFPLRGRVRRSLNIPRGHTLSWFGFPEAQSCTLAGVRWPFTRRRLAAEGFHSLSNEPKAKTVHLQQRSGRSLFVVSIRPQKTPF
ncbi:MAG: thiamine diphosphokinase [bacterium]|nr:thiamine diphosphokinase [bacterium]